MEFFKEKYDLGDFKMYLKDSPENALTLKQLLDSVTSKEKTTQKTSLLKC